MTRLITALLLVQAIARFGRVAAADSTHAADQPAPSAVPSGLSGPDYTGPSAGSDECDPEMVGFELVTGYVFTAPTNMLESIPGTLMLTDCLETCQANDSCQAVNYETGLCVLFSSNADSNPGKIESLSISAYSRQQSVQGDSLKIFFTRRISRFLIFIRRSLRYALYIYYIFHCIIQTIASPQDSFPILKKEEYYNYNIIQ